MLDNRFNRRAVLGIASTALAAAATPPKPRVIAKVSAPPIVLASTKGSVDTGAGRVRGFVRNGIHTFKGIPYAGSTAGTNRFQPPTKPLPWPGVRSSLQFGAVCPQGERTGWANDESAFMFEWDDGQPGEDCLRVNLWTPGVSDNAKRPVMVWLHGGGFSAGSGQELKSYDGENLAKRGNVVVVSLNHRLNAFGYLNLADFGGRYEASANVGMLDIVAALEWVRDNISNFGGDPDKVMIFGQSGGGGKVGTLMAMPSAKGLFHRAAIQSGSSLRQQLPENSRKLARAFLDEVRIDGSNVDRLLSIPFQILAAASVEAVRKLAPPGGNIPGTGMGYNWGPTVDSGILPHHSFDPVAPAESSDVPLLVGTVLNEFTTGIGRPDVELMTEEAAKQQIEGRYPGKGAAAYEAFRKANRGEKPFDILSRVLSAGTRRNAVTQATRKAAQGGAAAYLYWFNWKTPVLDGRPRAFHCAELPFVFANTDRCAAMTGGTIEARILAGRMADAWIAFARGGNPNHAGLPEWPAFEPGTQPCMIFDEKCAVRDDPDGEERKVLA